MKKYSVYLIMGVLSVVIFFLQFNYGKKYMPSTYYQVYLDNEVIGTIESSDELKKYISENGELIKKQVNEYSVDVDRIFSVEETMKKVITQDNDFYDTYIKMNSIKNNYLVINQIVDDKGVIKDIEKYNKLSSNIINSFKLEDNTIIDYDIYVSNSDKNIKILQNQITEYIYSNRHNLNLTSSEISNIEDYISNKLNDIDYSKYIYMKNYVEENKIYLSASNVYEPLGIYIKKINTYDKKIDTVEDVYNLIVEKKPCTIDGYQFKIKKEKSIVLNNSLLLGANATSDYKDISSRTTEDIIVYVTEPKVFEEAINELTAIFVGKDNYNAYKNNTQKEIKDTGVKIDNVYLKENVTMKEKNISVKEKIYNDSSDLASYLLYGDNIQTKIVYASSEDNIINLSYKNGITIEEFFLSNPKFTNVNNIFYDNQPINIKKLNPKLNLVVEETQIEDKSIDYKVIEKYDDSMIKGDEKVEQEGSKGLMRVNQSIQKVNGSISYVNLISKETIKSAKDKVILVGTKEIPNVGSTTSWGWPTNSGYTLTSYFGWRAYPFNPGSREFHAGLDIAGLGYGSPVYASNNGTIEVMQSDRWNYGTHIIINHNNGYWTTYGHMSGFASGLKIGSTVSRGQLIGYIGATGAATGPHLHFEIRVGENRYANVVDPLPYLKK